MTTCLETMIQQERKPTISVLIPVYNGGKHFRASVESLLSQTFQDFECLILNDGSKDESGKIADELSRADWRVRVIHRANRGLIATLNELLDAALGNLMARMDADDFCLQTRLAAQVRYFHEHSAVVCLGGSHSLIDEADRRIALIKMPEVDQAMQQLALRGHTAICHPAAMVPTEALVACYRSASYPTEDLNLWSRLGETGGVANSAEPLICYRMHRARSVSRRRKVASGMRCGVPAPAPASGAESARACSMRSRAGGRIRASHPARGSRCNMGGWPTRRSFA